MTNEENARLNTMKALLKEKGVKGIWQDEPDHLFLPMKEYLCEIRRNSELLSLCGYVHILADDPVFSEKLNDIHVHGGLTYDEIKDGKRIVGFDCAHMRDLVPVIYMIDKDLLNKRFTKMGIEQFKTYRTVFFVRQELEKLVEQLKSKKKEIYGTIKN